MNIYEIRKLGREYCQTEGSEHYKGQTEPIETIIYKGAGEQFCWGNIIKYANRYAETQNLNDLKKISDYAHILCGIKLSKNGDVDKFPCDKCSLGTLKDVVGGEQVYVCNGGVYHRCVTQNFKFFLEKGVVDER